MRTLVRPSFVTTIIDHDPGDGYWVHAVDVNGDGRVDVVASGLTRGEVVWYENPADGVDRPWRRRSIATLAKPVSVDAADLTGDGRPDLVICHDYGDCTFNFGSQDGKISWLHNPTAIDPDGSWRQRPVADLVATHRVRLGRFTGDRLQLAALPVVGPDGGADAVQAPVRAMLYEVPHRLRAEEYVAEPDDLDQAAGWPATEIDTEHFRVIHGVLVGPFANDPAARDSLLLASAEGITWLRPDPDGVWHRSTIGRGTGRQRPREFPAYEFSGSGNLALGRVDGRPQALILAVEPFHGNTIAAYVRPPTGAAFDQPWQRRVVEVIEAPDAQHDAVAHHVVAADFDGDGDDEFLVAVRGPAPAQGVFYYKFDANGEVLVREQVSTGSTARIAVADYNRDGRLDFVTTSYDTVGYYEADDPRIALHTNTFAPPARVATPAGGDG